MIVAVGTRMPAWVDEACTDYARRMPRHLPLQLTEVRPEPRTTGKTSAQNRDAEAARMERAIPAGATRIALDERGTELTTAALARWLDARSGEGADLAFLVGGPDGLAGSVRASARLCLRLSALTLPHALARVVLAEQLYRASTILQGHPYHRE